MDFCLIVLLLFLLCCFWKETFPNRHLHFHNTCRAKKDAWKLGWQPAAQVLFINLLWSCFVTIQPHCSWNASWCFRGTRYTYKHTNPAAQEGSSFTDNQLRNCFESHGGGEGGKKKKKKFILGLLKHKGCNDEMNNWPLWLYMTHLRMLPRKRASWVVIHTLGTYWWVFPAW